MSLIRLASLVAKIDLSSDTASATLAQLAASYTSGSAERNSPPTRATSKPSKLAQRKAEERQAKETAVPSSHTSSPAPMPTTFLLLPEKGTLTAADFLLKIQPLGPTFSDTSHNVGEFSIRKDQTILAIAAYCGYDRYLEFGLQEFNARRLANLELYGAIAFPSNASGNRDNPSHRVTIAGLIAGMPDELRKRVLDLQGRERLAHDTAIDHEKTACGEQVTVDAHGAPCCCQGHIMARLERNRAAQIHADLEAMIG